jgi:hypothetical protein
VISTVSVLTLQDKLTNNYEDIKTVLIHLGFKEDKIRYHPNKKLITSPRPEEGADNPNGFLLYTDSLKYLITTRSGNGNIFTLVMDIKRVNFAKSLELICRWLNIKAIAIKTTYPFSGFYKKLYKADKNEEVYINEYTPEDLPIATGLSQRFLNDGISLQIQEKWGIRYDYDGDNILIPIHDCTGRLVGCKARSNEENCPHNRRWFAYLPYPKNNIVYGYFENYKYIQQKRKVFIFEAEKSVLQCASFGFNIAVAIGGHNISAKQVQYILSLMVEEIIVAFDTDVIEDEIIYESKKLLSNRILNNKVGYIYDSDHLLGDKMSPSDKGKNIFKKLLKNIKWLRREKNDREEIQESADQNPYQGTG